MKNVFLKTLFLIMSLFVSFVSFAGPGDPEGEPLPEETPADIDSKIIVLFVLGVAFAVYMLMQGRKQVRN